MEQDYYIALDGCTIGYRTSTGVFLKVCKAKDRKTALKILACIQDAGYNIYTQPIDDFECTW